MTSALNSSAIAAVTIKVRRTLNVRLPANGEAETHRMQGENVEETIEAILIKEDQTDQHQAAGQQMRDIEGEAVHQTLRVTNSNNVPSSPSINATPRNSGTRNTRILATVVSKTARRTPASVSLTR